ncbi:uncharacterized protein SPSK_03767 [Sporothrix schenckii 1099-18]|uniref:Uncharacterized protein n=1 Tax=Sporothrix schenckii 1099-18 TaxID=1397361 RepID=A0A0F2M0P8_SPOSC|nr:uncharacterized protein SPSK_03767 [Sporothrix schenckii 1099-18]KJR82335.1 hypothetical protein SPSK_03767 [Sporothrix schenckii 1099-18]
MEHTKRNLIFDRVLASHPHVRIRTPQTVPTGQGSSAGCEQCESSTKHHQPGKSNSEGWITPTRGILALQNERSVLGFYFAEEGAVQRRNLLELQNKSGLIS